MVLLFADLKIILLIPNHPDQKYPAFVFDSLSDLKSYIAKSKLPVPDYCKNLWELEEEHLINVKEASAFYINLLKEQIDYHINDITIEVLFDIYTILQKQKLRKNEKWIKLVLGYAFLFGEYLKIKTKSEWTLKQQPKGYYSYMIPCLEVKGKKKEFMNFLINCLTSKPAFSFHYLKHVIYDEFEKNKSLKKDFNIQKKDA